MNLFIKEDKMRHQQSESPAGGVGSLRALALALFAMGTASLSVVGALQAMSISMHLAPAAVAMLVTVFGVTFALGAPLLQVMLSHIARKRLLLGGLLVMAAGAALCALAPNYPTLLLARFLTAAGAAAVSPVASSIGAALVPAERRGHALAVVFSGMTMASVAGMPLASWLAANLGWRVMFGVTAVLGLAAAIAVWRFVGKTPAGAPVCWIDFGRLLVARDVLAAQAVMVLAMTALFCTYTLITPILASRFHASAGAISVALGVYGVAGLLGNRAARHAAARWSAERSILTALAVLGLAFLGVRLLPASLPGALWLVMALMAAWAVAIDLFLPAQQRRMVEMRSQAPSLVLAINSSTLFVGMAAGSFVGGKLAVLAGLDAVTLASCLLALSAALLLLAPRSAPASARTAPQ